MSTLDAICHVELLYGQWVYSHLEKDPLATCLLQIVQCPAWTQTRGSSPGKEGGREGEGRRREGGGREEGGRREGGGREEGRREGGGGGGREGGTVHMQHFRG